MADQPHHPDTHEVVATPRDALPQPMNPEAMPEKIILPDGKDQEMEQQLEKKQTNKSDIPEPEYPPLSKVIPIMAALYMTFFLVALVLHPNPLHLLYH